MLSELKLKYRTIDEIWNGGGSPLRCHIVHLRKKFKKTLEPNKILGFFPRFQLTKCCLLKQKKKSMSLCESDDLNRLINLKNRSLWAVFFFCSSFFLCPLGIVGPIKYIEKSKRHWKEYPGQFIDTNCHATIHHLASIFGTFLTFSFGVYPIISDIICCCCFFIKSNNSTICTTSTLDLQL